jgi:hypothetical protein
MDAEKFDRLLENTNTRLRNANIKVSIERVNHRLYLRATFPPKPDSGKAAPWQQRLSIAQANPDGLKLAESKAKTIGGQLDLETFELDFRLKKAVRNTPELHFGREYRERANLFLPE